MTKHTLPRSWSGGGATVFGTATLIPAVTARPRSWVQSQLRSAVPPALREGLDRCGAEERRQVPRALRRAAESSGFEAAARAAASIFQSGRVPDAAGVDLLARRDARRRRGPGGLRRPRGGEVTALAGVGETVAAGARCSLTKSVLAEWAASGTPRQREYLLGYLEAAGGLAR